MPAVQGKQPPSKAKRLKQLFAEGLPPGRLVVSLSKHYVAVINGTIYDTHYPDRDGTRCVYGYWSK
jgi:hypothetical protein